MLSYLIKREIKKQLKRSTIKRKKRFLDYRDVDAITFMVEQGQLEELKPLMQSFLLEGIQASIVVLNIAGIPIDPEYPAVSIIEIQAENTVKQKMLPNKEIVKRFISIRPSVVCDLTTQEFLPLLYLLSISMATMKIGIEKGELPLFDFMLKPLDENSSYELAKNLFFYWKSIDIKNNNS